MEIMSIKTKKTTNTMKITKHQVFYALAFTLLVSSCDTPHTMAEHHYFYAESKLEDGDTATALKHARLSEEHARSCKRCDDLLPKASKLITTIESKQ